MFAVLLALANHAALQLRMPSKAKSVQPEVVSVVASAVVFVVLLALASHAAMQLLMPNKAKSVQR